MTSSFLSILQHSHNGLRITGAIAAGLVLIACLAINLLRKPAGRRLILPAIILGIGVVVLGWALFNFEAA
jgi:hypothetical protein